MLLQLKCKELIFELVWLHLITNVPPRFLTPSMLANAQNIEAPQPSEADFEMPPCDVAEFLLLDRRMRCVCVLDSP